MTIYYILLLVLGLVIGSFMSVVINRLPKGQSVVTPSSHCPHCLYSLAWYEMIPVFSYVIQQAKCRRCGVPISPVYPLVELLTGVVYVLLLMHFGLSSHLWTALVYISILIPILFIDLQHQIIPDSLIIAGAVLAMLTMPIGITPLTDRCLGALVGGGVMLVIAVVSRGGMGGGDIKMMAMMGLFLGWKLTLVALFISFISGGFISLILLVAGLKKRRDPMPFGPFLAVGGLMAYVYGSEILVWYLSRTF